MTEFNAAIFAWPCVLSEHPPRSGGISPGEGWDAATDAVGKNCKRGATTENQGAGAWYMCQGMCL